MKKIIIALILVFTTFGYSQNCKYEKNEVDEFTKNKILKVKGSDIFRTSMFTGLSFQMSKINDIKFITFALVSKNAFVLEEGNDKLMFKTKDGRIINIAFNKTIVSEIQNMPNVGTLFFAHQNVKLTDDLISQLNDIEIIKARIYIKDGYIEEDVKKKSFKNISTDLKCIE